MLVFTMLLILAWYTYCLLQAFQTEANGFQERLRTLASTSRSADSAVLSRHSSSMTVSTKNARVLMNPKLQPKTCESEQLCETKLISLPRHAPVGSRKQRGVERHLEGGRPGAHCTSEAVELAALTQAQQVALNSSGSTAGALCTC